MYLSCIPCEELGDGLAGEDRRGVTVGDAEYVRLEVLVGHKRDAAAEGVHGIEGAAAAGDAVPAQVLGRRVLPQNLGENALLHLPSVRRDVLNEVERLAVRPGGVAGGGSWLGTGCFRHGTALRRGPV